jgi:hypothetical protein
LFPEDGRTELTKLIVALRNFANAPKVPSQEHCSIYNSSEVVGSILIHDKPFVRDYKEIVFVVVKGNLVVENDLVV